MIDVLTTFKGHKYQLLYGIIALILGGGSWILSPKFAKSKAQKMETHSKIFLYIEKKLFLRILFFEEYGNLLLALFFFIIGILNIFKIPMAKTFAGNIM